MKKLKFLGLALLMSLAFTAFAACGGNVNVESVTLNKTTASVTVDSTLHLTAIITPSNASNKSVMWTSDNPDVATVLSTGLVTGVTVGTAVITVRTNNGDKIASCTVTVNAPKTVEQIQAVFETAGYTVIPDTTFGLSLVAVKGTNTLTILFFTSDALATAAKPTYEITATAFGQTCKQDGKIIYYGTAAAIDVYETI